MTITAEAAPSAVTDHEPNRFTRFVKRNWKTLAAILAVIAL